MNATTSKTATVVYLIRWCALCLAGFYRDVALVERQAAKWHKARARSNDDRADAIVAQGEKAVTLVMDLHRGSPEVGA